MAAANRFKRVRSQLPSCYYEGFLEKKSIKDKMGRKLWTSLCGNSLFFYNSTKDSVYIEKLELSDLVSVSDDCCRDRNLDAARFTLHMKNEDIKMIAPSLEARELWKGFMLSVSKVSSFAETDNENGEKSLHCPKVPSPTPPVPPPKPAFAETNNENGETIVQCPKVPSPTPPVPPPKPVPNNQRSSSEPNTYINVSNAGEYEVDHAACSPPPVLPRLPAGRYLPHQNSMPPDLISSSDVERKPLVPSGYPKKSSRSNSLSGMPNNIPKCQQQHVDINAGTAE
ncbi:actin cytoskeleton-regulatory complex protein sla1-like [Sinocyclocheilus grahami]|uniref:actin cytoskeleton-regulatory complex protein sla1-like n=1 Tax=Sinocyclocheilus grahami TaxID=75366 RepID=UPI0007AC8577|nr:PREDICTED: actin cytoskeleton-regulatory complex protein sla1-like [Sinocyclocheilus grahami]